MSAPTKVPQEIIDAIMLVRYSGVTNMFDLSRVVELLSFESDDAAEWVRTHKSEYANGIFNGFKAC